jgi:hypothetical protein
MTYVASAIIIGMSLLLGAGGILVLRYVIPPQRLHKNHEIGGLIFLQVGVIYAVLIGFVVVATWDDFQQAAEQTEREAAALGDVARIAGEFASPDAANVRTAVEAYLHAVVEDEWAAMDKGTRSERAIAASRQLWNSCLLIKPRDARESALYGKLLDRITESRDLRSLRLIEADDSIPGYMWFTLIVGAFVIVNLSFFFGMENAWAHMALTTMLSGMLAIVLSLALLLEHPYSGDVRVQSSAFSTTLSIIESM